MRTKIFFILSLLFLAGAAGAAEYHVDRGAKNHVKFISDAPIEDFEGVTGSIDGYVLWEGDSLKEGEDHPGSELYFEVELANLDTGIGLRNRHMRENYLETDKYPYARYRGKISRIKPSPSGGFVVISDGEFEVHGVSKPVTIIGEVSGDGKSYHVISKFDVRLPDHNIDVPSLMFMKINEIIKLELDFHLRAASISGEK